MEYWLLALLAALLAATYTLLQYRARHKRQLHWLDDVLLTAEDLKKHARELARYHKATRNRKVYNSLKVRLNENFRFISYVYSDANADAREKKLVSHSAQWLLDNFYIIEEQVKEIRQEFTAHNFRGLQLLKNTALRGYPRIYALALELVSHTDGKLDEDILVDFMNAYQQETKLGIAEIWALALMVRIALIEKIRSICQHLELADRQWKKVAADLTNPDMGQLREMIAAWNEFSPAYVEHLLEHLRRMKLDTGEVTGILEKKLLEFDTTIEEVVSKEHQAQATRTISMSNAIISLKLVASLDWNDIFELISPVDKILADDYWYPKMDFESRDYYRHRIEDTARRLKVSETRVARRLMACRNQDRGDTRLDHVGYYLLDKGRPILLEKLGRKIRPLPQLGPGGYLALVLVITAWLTILMSIWAFDGSGLGLLALALTVLPASDIALALTNWILTHIYRPSFLPKLEFREGLSDDAATLVTIPALIPDATRAKELMAQLEVHYLANREPNLFFALVGDFKDAPEQTTPEDEEVIAAARAGISALNQKYCQDRDLFFYLHRQRSYNKAQGKWMGWERKRGALDQLNALLIGQDTGAFTWCKGELNNLTVRYVITLDADTRLPMETAKKLVGAIAHPLHQARIKNGIVREGYGLIQPRIGISIESANSSRFARIIAGNGGIDAYTTSVSDIYQDLFDEGIFTGKGIYDLWAYRDVLAAAIPENTVLSHDLLEGSYLRTGLVTDLELVDDFPGRYSAYMTRLHRWTRGDWQLLPWLGRRVRNQTGSKVPNPLGIMSRWKMLDNLRRSLLPVSLVLLFIMGLTVLPGTLPWLLVPLLTLAAAPLLGLLDYGLGARTPTTNSSVVTGFRAALYQWLLQLAFLPYHAYIMADAIIRTLWRMFITRRHLLEWTTAADVERTLRNDGASYLRRNRPVLVFLALNTMIFLAVAPESLLWAMPFFVLWFLSPLLATWASGNGYREPLLEEEDVRLLRRLARKTWNYYEDLATAENNWLPPDNYQVDPPNGVDKRTSPTNIGFLLAAILAARDFGYLTTSKMLELIENTLTTLEKMEKWHGHLYNWYSTSNLEVLRPRYISTVDSGNLVGFMIAVREGLREYLDARLADNRLTKGLEDTAELYGIQLPPLAMFGWPGDWFNLLAEIKSTDDPRLDTMIAMFREEEKALFPHTEILMNPPVFFKEKKFTVLADTVAAIVNKTSPRNLQACYAHLLSEADQLLAVEITPEQQDYLMVLKNDISRAKLNIDALCQRLNELIERLDALVSETSFSPLYDHKRQLFSIGYDSDTERLTNSCYDLLASEARLASYLAIVSRHAPKKHWFKLGRALSRINGHRSLVSWAGTMFEYLMPPLLMKTYPNTLLDETVAAAISAQIAYGEARRIPWGTSESGYYGFDLRLNYQYRAFGVPELGLKRGLINDAVVSPYSTLLALPFAPQKSMDNIRVLMAQGVEGQYGLFEAVDYTPERLAGDAEYGIVKSYMAHHQGMGFIALTNVLLGNLMVKRFHASPLVRAGELLLQERLPLRAIITKEHKEPVLPLTPSKTPEIADYTRSFGRPKTQIPNAHLLSNGHYSVMLTDRGGGFSKLGSLQVSRWRQDSMANYGNHIFVRNLNTNRVWSTAWAPLSTRPEYYKVRFYPDRATYLRADQGVDTRTQITVSTEDNVEIRALTLANHGLAPVTIEVTSYMEIVLAHASADLAHPGFSNLFVRTQALPETYALLAWRRPRSPGEQEVYAFHSVNVQGEALGRVNFETDRARFLGRTRQINNPAALHQPLSNSEGAVLDPIFSLRRQIRLQPGGTATVTFCTGVANSHPEALKLVAKYTDIRTHERSFALAYTRSQVETRHMNLNPDEVRTAQSLVAPLLFPSPLRLKQQAAIAANTRGQPSLWAYGISGDNPIILTEIRDEEDMDILREAIRAQEYLKLKGMVLDLVVLNKEESSYLQPIHELIRETVQTIQVSDILNKPGGVFIRNSTQMAPEDRTLLYASARLVIQGEGGPLASQIKFPPPVQAPPLKQFQFRNLSFLGRDKPLPVVFDNSYGGFSPDGKEYIIRLRGYNNTPAPWANVIANPKFGFLVTESGGGYTWAENSRENKLTPWSNDPVSDPPGEIIYLRDDETGDIWTITPLPIREKPPYTIRHGAGYSVFEYRNHGIVQQLTCFVDDQDSIKLSRIRLTNRSGITRHLTLTGYIRPVLGVNEEVCQDHVVSAFTSDMLCFTNAYNTDFPEQTIFWACSEPLCSHTADRQEFMGVGGPSNPDALSRIDLGKATGAGLDPCGAIQVELLLKPGAEKELVFMLGQARDNAEAAKLRAKYSDPATAEAALSRVKKKWQEMLSVVHVSTPDESMNLMLNQWLLYQAISCRIWARSGFYQSGGAYGFRDQLQDTMNLASIAPELTRQQIIRHAGQQFEEGDVQHWWHPGTGNRGVRTRFSDDRLWLPLAVTEYVRCTGDTGVLNEKVPYLKAPPLDSEEDERYGIPDVADLVESVYLHCVRAIERSLGTGSHGLPLMGSGDWNDGMSTVGNKGRGESVWLAWFLAHVLEKFAPLCEDMSEPNRADQYLKHAKSLKEAVEANAWDGQWYLRAFFDDGTPLGSSANPECSIDSLAQSWAVIAGGDGGRARQAMGAVEDYLVLADPGIVLLFTPPFDQSEMQPGYIKGYVPGVRENGGQYTHAAAWVISALARMGKGDKAWELFRMINPVNHSRTGIECATYKVEPYVAAADVYNVHPHVGRGGWTWYTGAAAWLWRVAIEDILGFQKQGQTLSINPCIPRDWSEYKLTYKYCSSTYHVTVKNPSQVRQGVRHICLDGKQCQEITLVDDGQEHQVEVVMGRK